jgi:hypothetical protein
MNTNTTALRVITLSDGRRVKEVPGVYGCEGCMFYEPKHPRCGCTITGEIAKQIGEDCKTPREGCNAGVIYQPADPEPVAVAEPVKREPLTEQSIVDLIPTTGITSSREAIWFARAIERAHGIGQEGGAA